MKLYKAAAAAVLLLLIAPVLRAQNPQLDEFRARRKELRKNLDGTVVAGETCRESLASSLYVVANREKTIRQGNSNIFLFRGEFESYRVHASHNQQQCEIALTGLFQRQRKN